MANPYNAPYAAHRSYTAGNLPAGMANGNGCASNPEMFLQGCEPYGMFPGCRVRWLDFSQDAVAAGASATVVVRPQNPFVGVRLVVPSTVGIFFDIDNLQIGTQSQKAAVENATSAVVYSETAFDVGLLMNFAANGTQIQLTVTNTDASARDFRATIIGFTPPGSTLGPAC